MARSVLTRLPCLAASATRTVPRLSSVNCWSGGMTQVTLLRKPVRTCAPGPTRIPSLAATHAFPSSMLTRTIPFTSATTIPTTAVAASAEGAVTGAVVSSARMGVAGGAAASVATKMMGQAHRVGRWGAPSPMR